MLNRELNSLRVLNIDTGKISLTNLNKNNCFQVCRVALPPSVKQMALSRAKEAIGCAYNDLFAPDHINSKGDRSFYCSQLVTDAYSESEMEFPEHFLQFGSGETLDYWRRFYEDRGRQVIFVTGPKIQF